MCICMYVFACVYACNFWRIMFRSFFKRKMLHATGRTGGSYFYCHWLCHCHCHHQLPVPVPVTAPVSFPFPLPIPDPPLITKVRVRVKVCLKSNRLDMKLGAVPSRLAATAAIGPRDRPSGSVGFIDISQMEHTKAVEKRNGKKAHFSFNFRACQLKMPTFIYKTSVTMASLSLPSF